LKQRWTHRKIRWLFQARLHVDAAGLAGVLSWSRSRLHS
jgi:hypothetical protein